MAREGVQRAGVELRIKNAFEPEHGGTLISQDYKSEKPCVEIIAGRKDVFGIEVFDQDMLGDIGYDMEISKLLKQLKLYVVNKDSDANSITYYASGSRKLINRAARLIEEQYPAAEVTVHNLAIVSAIGSDLKVKGILAKTVAALAEAGISIQAIHQSIRQVEMQCVVNEEDYDAAIAALPPGGRLVANAVTLETESLLTRWHADHGGRLLRIDIAEAAPLGGMRGWTPARPIVQWSVTCGSPE